jgi:NADH:ubiquinone oxidoreductase subunit 5 (subunit L)/multisubunit Na+/H+ antiporter MnhA subunit
MVLGVGTALPMGIVGGLFHMINHAMYKSCLFLTGGAVEKQAGTTNLEKLGGIASKMPVTFACFLIAAMAISGAPPLNGFYSKELVYEAAFDRNVIFYIAAVMGTFFTAASFLKLGHAAYFGRRDPANDGVKEAPLAMLVPMIIIAGGCVLFGLFNAIPLQNLIEPFIAKQLNGETFASLLPHKWFFAVMTLVALGGALINHYYGVSISGRGLGAVDHIHHAPVLSEIYQKAERRYFDPYDIGLKIAQGFAWLSWWIDRANDWIYNGASVYLSLALGDQIKKLHTGNYSMYVAWSLIGTAAVIIYLVRWL